MITVVLLAGYVAVLAWFGPVLLGRLTAGGVSARLGLTAWLAALLSVLACAAVALQYLARAAIAGWTGLAEVICRSAAGHVCTPGAYESAILGLALGVAGIVATLAACVLTWRYGHHVHSSQRQTRAHAQAARITGRGLPGHAAAVVLDAAQPAAYCAAGRPSTIVLTSGAVALLDADQLAAVLAHERAHLAGRHHLLITLTRGLATVLPAVPLFARAVAGVTALTEMCADDAAARRSGRRTLVAALVTMKAGAAVVGRAQRLLDAPGRARHLAYGAALAGVIAALALAPGLLAALGGPGFPAA